MNYENEKQHQQLGKALRYIIKVKISTIEVLGNHDYGKDWVEQKVADRITEQLKNAGVSYFK